MTLTTEQQAALQDVLMSLQCIDWANLDLDELAQQMQDALWIVTAIRDLKVIPYHPPTEAQIEELLRAFKDFDARFLFNTALSAQSDTLTRLAGVPFGDLPTPEE